ncbi:hypothetical protein [Halorubrum halophilum]|uniref:hypothetical protein n=1 Tax=Halorubrum halophilum TaxID=413816 RepID=UPI0012AB50A3|nr:hypothetical protein [Halorubrum halophilum]
MVTRKEADQKAELVKRKLRNDPNDSDVKEAKKTFRRIKPSLDEVQAETLEKLIENAKES